MTLRLLVVDDDRGIRESFVRQLGRAGHDVESAPSAEAAMRAVAARQPEAVITDLRMNGATGLELLAWLRDRVPDVDVLVMTAHEDMSTALEAIKAGAYDFLVKPLDLDVLERVLNRCERDRGLRRTPRSEPAPARRAAGALVGRDPRMIEISKTIAAVAATTAPVLIRGETGTGKEVIARAIHAHSASAREPFVAVNCTAVPETLLESELFGHVRGAYTGAHADRTGRFEMAERGTIFLDEIGDVSLIFQAKLLRVLQEGEFTPVGGDRTRTSDARVIAATHRPLEAMVRAGSFREDLYFRLRIVEIEVPPLRERRGDIRLLADWLLARVATRLGRERAFFTDETVALLERHHWPGNVRELENAITRALVLARGAAITPDLFALGAGSRGDDGEPAAGGDLSLATMERHHVARVLALTAGNKRKAARMLRISRQRLDRILERHGVTEMAAKRSQRMREP